MSTNTSINEIDESFQDFSSENMKELVKQNQPIKQNSSLKKKTWKKVKKILVFLTPVQYNQYPPMYPVYISPYFL